MRTQKNIHYHWPWKFVPPHRLIVMLALASWSPAAGSASPFHDDEHGPQSFKEIVQKLVRASRENLRPLKTFRVEMKPGREYWYEVEVKLPGAKTCRIYEHPQMVYRCEWNRAPTESGDSVYTTVVNRIEEALDSSNWTVRRSSNKVSVTRFEPVNPRRHPVFEVRLGGRRSDPIIEVLLFPVDRWGSSE
jgi:hypothetical protein